MLSVAQAVTARVHTQLGEEGLLPPPATVRSVRATLTTWPDTLLAQYPLLRLARFQVDAPTIARYAPPVEPFAQLAQARALHSVSSSSSRGSPSHSLRRNPTTNTSTSGLVPTEGSSTAVGR